jgi:hypothetical protein
LGSGHRAGHGRRTRIGRGGLEAFELVEGALVGALGRVNAALEPNEVAIAQNKGVTKGASLVEAIGGLHFVLPQLSFGQGEAPELPVVTDEGVDIVALLGVAGRKHSRYSAVRVSRSAACSPRMV